MSAKPDLPEQLLEKAIALGAEAAEVYQSGSLSRPVLFEGNRLKQVETSQSEGVALRLWKNGRPGLAVGYGPIEPEALVEKALAISPLNEPETPYLSTGAGAEAATETVIEAADSRRTFPEVGEPVEVTQLVEWGRAAIAQLRDRFPEVVCEAELTCDIDHTRLINSAGLDYRYQDTSLSSYINAELVSQDDFLNVGDGSVSRNSLDMNATVNNILKRLQWAEKSVTDTLPNKPLPVIFTPGSAWLLWNTVQAALNGKRVNEGSSPWSQKWGECVMDSAIALHQDPFAGPYSCPFDDEGTPTQSLKLIENGRIKNWYCDHTTAQLSSESSSKSSGKSSDKSIKGVSGSTGNGIRPGLGSYPTPALINCLITPGQTSWEALLAQFPEAIIVDQVMGEGGDITGDLSINLELGYRVQQGEVIGRVKDAMVSGNAYNALNHLIALGSDARWSGATYTPSVAVGGLSVTQ
ncbi:MAG: TldD/PmbA family protein [Cyanobacteria bacterium P01_A01_bin.116]